MHRIKYAKYLATFVLLLSLGLGGCAAGDEEEGTESSLPGRLPEQSQVAEPDEAEAEAEDEAAAVSEEKAVKENRCCALKTREDTPDGSERTFDCYDLGKVSRIRANANCSGDNVVGVNISSATVRNGKCSSFPSCPVTIQLP